MVSNAFVAIHLGVKPFKRTEDGAMMLAAEGALVLTYFCSLLIKSCDIAPTVCPNYGLGNTANGEHCTPMSAARRPKD
eukprot:2306053-Prymnesium_polylepis.3